jgi:hypothetical protein
MLTPYLANGVFLLLARVDAALKFADPVTTMGSSPNGSTSMKSQCT